MKVRFEVVQDVGDGYTPDPEVLQTIGQAVVAAAQELGGATVHAVVKTKVEPATTKAFIAGAVAEPEIEDLDDDEV